MFNADFYLSTIMTSQHSNNHQAICYFKSSSNVYQSSEPFTYLLTQI